MPGTKNLPANTDAYAADSSLKRVDDEGVVAQANATLALAHEQRTIALIEAAKLLQGKGRSADAGSLLNEALARMGAK
ncbi:MAG: hypothetical protein ACTIA2_08330 [Brevibacterium aurantiacum]|uniref:hypothetical protein n=1 Tax=Brevibacterium aurantiacum TaxID=273384 RepID=UPI000DF17838|nr:hypothetical protein [Brevibacterium aurantiacum]RCS87913.1 hypothetical protein CIK63_12060 [Brevibacterium aurantiacum]RCS93471.1 hypothetical protein CIK61_15360 [Brevibacterium aurantiacum]